MSDLISRDALHKVWCANCDNKHLCGGKVGCDDVKKLYDMPTIEAIPVEWVQKQMSECVSYSIVWIVLRDLLREWERRNDEADRR